MVASPLENHISSTSSTSSDKNYVFNRHYQFNMEKVKCLEDMDRQLLGEYTTQKSVKNDKREGKLWGQEC